MEVPTGNQIKWKGRNGEEFTLIDNYLNTIHDAPNDICPYSMIFMQDGTLRGISRVSPSVLEYILTIVGGLGKDIMFLKKSDD